jgi:hypothetical protein
MIVTRGRLIASIAVLTLTITAFGAGYGFKDHYYSWESWYTHDRHVNNVLLKINPSDSGCPDKNYPIGVDIENHSGLTMGWVDFRIAARHPGRSTDLTVSGSGLVWYTDDHIIPPGSRIDLCFKIPYLNEKIDMPLTELEWSIAEKVIRFRN